MLPSLVGDSVGYENSPVHVNSAVELILALLLATALALFLVGAASIVVFGVLTYRVKGKALQHVILVALLGWITSLPIGFLLPRQPWILDIAL